MRGGPAGLGFGACAFGPLVAFGEDALNGIEKAPAQEKIEKKNDYDRGNSRQEQLTELVNDLH